MNINVKEKEKIYSWSCENTTQEIQRSVFLPYEEDKETYFVKRNEHEEYLQEYGFESLPELRERLSLLWEEDEFMDNILQVVLVAAFKNRPSHEIKNSENYKNNESNKDKEILPAYIYNF